MSASRLARFASLLAVLLTIGVSATNGSEQQPVTPALRGVREIDLNIYSLCAYRDFYDAVGVIRPQVARRLREAGFTLLAEVSIDDEENASAAELTVDIRCSGVDKISGGLDLSFGRGIPPATRHSDDYVFVVSILLRQHVKSSTKGQPECDAYTWIWFSPIQTERNRPFTRLRSAILGGVDEFLASWRRANQ